MPNLNGADAWLDRAKEHLKNLKTLCDSFAKAECDAMIASLNFDDIEGMPSWVYKQPTAQVDTFVQILIGESIQALRRSLDYLVYEIAWQDSGAEQQDTQFPIDYKESVFDGRRQRKRPKDRACYLVGIRDKHAAAIKLLQPFKGTKWTTSLANLSNPDKHRHLTVTNSRHSNQPSAWTMPVDATDKEIVRLSPTSFAFSWNVGDSANPMHMQFNISTFVAFEKGERIIEVLDQLKTEVAGVLEDFRPCFGGKCHH